VSPLIPLPLLLSAENDFILTSPYPQNDVLSPLLILSWNIHGNFALKLTSPNFSAVLSSFDVYLLQETHVQSSQSDAHDIPNGYLLHSVARPCLDEMGHPGGGIAALVRSSLDVTVRKDIMS
jgi:exonuclease III